MAHPGFVSTEVVAMSSPYRSVFPSPRLTPSPRLLLSLLPSATTLMPPTPVVRSPSQAQVLGPLAIVRSAPRMSRSPAPSRSPLPSGEANDEANNEAKPEADNEANILAKAEAMSNILGDAEVESDGSPGYITTDLDNARLHGYAMPVL